MIQLIGLIIIIGISIALEYYSIEKKHKNNNDKKSDGRDIIQVNLNIYPKEKITYSFSSSQENSLTGDYIKYLIEITKKE